MPTPLFSEISSDFQTESLPMLQLGVVLTQGLGCPSRWIVSTAGIHIDTILSPSCLLKPEIGDQVLLLNIDSTGANATCLIIAVLFRENLGNAELALPGENSVKFSTSASLRIESQAEISLFSPRLCLETKTIDIRFRTFRAVGKLVGIVAKEISTVSNTFKSFSKFLTAHTQTRSVVADESDVLRVGNQSVSVRHMQVTEAEHIVLNASETTRIDAKSILMG